MSKLDELVTSYGEKHTTELALKKECTEMSTQIKNILTEDNLTEYTAGGYTVTKTIAKTESMDEEQMLKVIKSAWTEKMGSMDCPYIKTVYKVDMDALESAIYAGEISKDTLLELDKCRTVKETVKLNLKKVKGE